MRVNNSGVQNPENVKTGQANQADRASNAAKTEDKKFIRQDGAVSGDAKTEISAKAREIASAKEVAQKAPDVREARIAELRRRIQSNEYNVKPEDVAEKMIKEHSDTKDL